MPKLPPWISRLFLVFLIFISAYLQILSPGKFSTVNDLCQDYLSVSWLKQNQPAYQLFSHTQCHIKSKLLPSQYNAHPPTSLIFFYPLAFTGLSKATLYWDISSVIFYFISLAVLLIIAKSFSFPSLAIAFSISTLWITTNLNYAVRNLSFFILLLTSLAIAGFIQKKYYISGFFIGIAVLVKIWLVIFLFPILFIPRFHKIIISSTLTIVTGLVLTMGLFGSVNITDYFSKVISYEKIFTNFPNNNSFTSSVTKVFLGVDPDKYPPL